MTSQSIISTGYMPG